MSITIKTTGLKELEANVAKLVKQQVPKATAKSVRQIANKAMRGATKTVAKEIGVNTKTVRGRAKMVVKPSAQNPRAMIRVNRSHMPLIRVLETKRNRIRETTGAIRVGQHTVSRGFRQRLKNGRTHIMFRHGRKRYGIDVAKIQLSQPLTNAFERELKDYSTKMQEALRKNLTLSFAR